MRRLLLPLSLAALTCTSALAQSAGLPALSPPASVPEAAIVESPGELTLAAALELASTASPELAVARRELAAVEALIGQAGIYPNPVLSATREEIGSDAPMTELVLSQEIELGGKRGARIKTAERARDVAAADFESVRARLRSEVTASFFDVLIAQERVKLSREAAELAAKARSAAARQVKAGKVSPVEETRAQVAEATTRVELSQAEAELDVARRRLAAHWGNPEPRFSRVASDVSAPPSVPPLTDLYARLNDSALLTRAHLEMARRRAALDLERSRRYPNVTVSVGAQRSDEFDSTQGVVGISIPLPLFDRNQGNVGEAQQRVYQAQDELLATEIRLKRELAQAHGQLSAARQQVEALRAHVLPGAQRAYEAATRGFELGKFSFLDVLDAQRTLLQVRTQYLGALSQANQASAELQRILGDRAVAPTPAAQP